MRPRVLVLDGFWNKTVAAVRSLGRRGFFVGVGERTLLSPAFFSRYCSRRFLHPSPARNPSGFLDALERELRIRRYDVVLPMEFSTQLLLSRNRERLETWARLPVPDADLCLRANDKGWVTRQAMRLGIEVPATVFPAGPDEASRMADRLPYPVLVKPRTSSGGRGIRRANRPEEFLYAYASVHARFPVPIVQEELSAGGTGLGVACLLNFSSRPCASFAYRRLREYPAGGGPSTLRESVLDPELVRLSETLLSSIGWTGVAMVEFRTDPRDGRPKLLEVNPRFWGSLNHAIVCGVDFPHLLYRLAVEGDLPVQGPYRAGVRTRTLLPGELLHFLERPETLWKRTGERAAPAPDDLIVLEDPFPAVGRIASLLAFLYDEEYRNMLRG